MKSCLRFGGDAIENLSTFAASIYRFLIESKKNCLHPETSSKVVFVTKHDRRISPEQVLDFVIHRMAMA